MLSGHSLEARCWTTSSGEFNLGLPVDGSRPTTPQTEIMSRTRPKSRGARWSLICLCLALFLLAATAARIITTRTPQTAVDALQWGLDFSGPTFFEQPEHSSGRERLTASLATAGRPASPLRRPLARLCTITRANLPPSSQYLGLFILGLDLTSCRGMHPVHQSQKRWSPFRRVASRRNATRQLMGRARGYRSSRPCSDPSETLQSSTPRSRFGLSVQLDSWPFCPSARLLGLGRGNQTYINERKGIIDSKGLLCVHDCGGWDTPFVWESAASARDLAHLRLASVN